MPTKPWPSKLKTKDSKPSTYHDLSVEIGGIAAGAGADDVYFFAWCWDMDSERQTSVLFRATSFDSRAERLAAIDSELVDAMWSGGTLVALESGIGREGFGVVHELKDGSVKPKKSTRLKGGNNYTSLGGKPDCLYAAGDLIQWFDGKAWKPTSTPLLNSTIRSVAGNATFAVAVGDYGRIVKLVKGAGTIFPQGKYGSETLEAVYVDKSGVVSIGGRNGTCLQGPLTKLVELTAPKGADLINDCCEFMGQYYWSVYGECGGVFVQKGKAFKSVFDGADCFRLTATDKYLYAATADGIARFDGKQWLELHVKYDNSKQVWSAAPARKRAKK